MSENTNLPGGALPPKPAEAAKVQPKKETVRINLPPKPTASPTIKLPTLPPSSSAAPVGATAAPMVSVPPTATAAAPAKAPLAPPTAARAATAAPTVSRPTAAAAAPAPMASRGPVIVALSPVDKALAVAAAVISLAALGSVIYIWQFVLAPALQVP